MMKLSNTQYTVVAIICVAITCVCLFAFSGRLSWQERIQPAVITEKVIGDSDDPAIWINYADPANSWVLGTDKDKLNGGIYVFDLSGNINKQKSIFGLKRVNNIDVLQGVNWGHDTMDIAVATERDTHEIRVLELPYMKFIDAGGIDVFEGEVERDPMGIALYKRPTDGAVFAIVSRKAGPSGSYLWQYRLTLDAMGVVRANLIRKFGTFSGRKEIESVAIDTLFSHVYYADEQAGIRQYHADPDKGNEELSIFGSGDFADDNEGISFYHLTDTSGYILVSDQGANQFKVYSLESKNGALHEHPLLATLPVMALESDGSEGTTFSLPGYESGLFVAMSTDKTFHYYRWQDFVKYSDGKLQARKTN
jgi:3-phytase